MKYKLFFSWLFVSVLMWQNADAQVFVDVGLGRSFQDQASLQLGLSKQFSSKFRAGINLQIGQIDYRFIEAKPVRKGMVTKVSIPLTVELTATSKIRLLGFFKTGVRFQNVFDPDENDQRDSILNSVASVSEIGLLIQLPISEKLSVQSGVTFPFVLQIDPSFLFEYQWTRIHAGLSYQVKKTVLFLNGSLGSAFGASGDTYKFIWNAQLGARFTFGQGTTQQLQLIDTFQ